MVYVYSSVEFSGYDSRGTTERTGDKKHEKELSCDFSLCLFLLFVVRSRFGSRCCVFYCSQYLMQSSQRLLNKIINYLRTFPKSAAFHFDVCFNHARVGFSSENADKRLVIRWCSGRMLSEIW